MRKYSWKPDVPNFQDYQYFPPVGLYLPPSVDLRKNFSIVHNQGNLGDCTSNAIVVAYDFTRIKEGLPPILPSRLFHYYNERMLEGNVGIDSGAYIRDGIKTLCIHGVCPEKMWDYNLKKFTVKPHQHCYDEALNHKVKKYMRINNRRLNDLKSCLAEGYGFVFGFSVFSSFESEEVAKTGMVPMPTIFDKMMGGHAVFCVGYSDSMKCFIVRNSWGIGWGDEGHFYIPYEYLTNSNLADDFWTMRLI